MKLSLNLAAAAVAVLFQTSLIAAHSMFLDAVGNANKDLHCPALGVDDLNLNGKPYFPRHWRDTIVFSKPWNPNNYCLDCPKPPSYKCAACMCRTPPCAEMFLKDCKLCPKYDLNCAKCRTRTPDTCGRRLRANESSLFIKDFDGPGTAPAPGSNGRELLDSLVGINTKVWLDTLVGRNSIPQVTEGGYLNISVFQSNADGAGPYSCRISYSGLDGVGNWNEKPLEIVLNVPGVESFSTAVRTFFPMVVKIPTALECSGTYSGKTNICMVQCVNTATNGPFGGCIPFELMPGPKPPPPPVVVPPPLPPMRPADVAKYGKEEELTEKQLEALGYYRRKWKRFRWFRD